MQIPNGLKNCVVFLGAKTQLGTYNAKGTGFFASYPAGFDNKWFQYLVTAKHNIDSLLQSKATQIGVRVNTKSGGAKWVDFPLEKWFCLQDPTSDIVLLSISLDELDPHVDWDQSCYPLTGIVDGSFINKWEMREGDEVFSIGLYSRYKGTSRNVPVVRVGNVATMEQPDIPTKLGEKTKAYLIESRSIGGLSGSPVFVNLGIARFLEHQQKPDETNISFFKEPYYSLLGVTHGHFEAREGYEVVNEGIAIVIPATRIIETIIVFKTQMAQHVERLKKESVSALNKL